MRFLQVDYQIIPRQESFFAHWEWPHYAFVIAILLIIYIFVIRAIFSIPAILRHLKAQTRFLSMIAHNTGSDLETVKELARQADDVIIE